MSKFEILDSLLQENKGFLKTSDVARAGISRAYLGEYARKCGLERVAHGFICLKMLGRMECM